MPIKGLAYLKTTWAFQERPVASAKLNLWDDRMEAALELAFFLLNQTWGGGNGIIAGATSQNLAVNALPTPGMSVTVQPGYAFISHSAYKLTQAIESATLAAPQDHPRIDLLQAVLATWSIQIKTGIEAATSAAPSADSDCIALARIVLRPGMTCIKNTDDGVNGYIIDARAFL